MTISTTSNRVVGVGNGATTIWNYGFLIPAADEVVVQITDLTTGVVTTLTTLQYSITGLGNVAGGTVTYTPAIGVNQTITIQRILPVKQTVSLSNQGSFYPTVVEGALDYLTMVCQQLSDALSRAIQSSATGAPTIDAGGNRIVNVGAPVATTDAARIGDVQAAQATANAVPTPVLGDVGKWLKATGAGAYAWTTLAAAAISDATAAGIALLTGANAAAQRASLGLGSLATKNSVGSGDIDDLSIVAADIAANTLTFAKFQRTGSAGQVWASAGAGADPGYVGGMTLIASGSPSAVATVDLTLPSGYKYFKLIVREVIPATNNTDLYLRVSQNNGAAYLATGYDYGANVTNATAGTTSFFSAATISTTGILLAQALPNANGYNLIEITIFPGTASRLFRANYSAGWVSATPATISQIGNGQYGGAVGVATNVRLIMSSGNVSLVYDLYGVT